MNKKFIIAIFCFIIILTPITAFAQEKAQALPQEEIFEAEVLEILNEREIEREDGSKAIQQNLKLRGLEGKWKGKEIVFEGISDVEVVFQNKYKKGDRVLVNSNPDIEGREHYYVIDYIRRKPLYLLSLLFAFFVVAIGRWKGFKALIGLVLSFFVILKFIVPKILTGSSPLLTAIIGSALILIFLIYLTFGLNKKSHLAIASILICLMAVGLLSILFSKLTRLTGLAQEEIIYLIGIGKEINFQGLLLAGMIIGALGVLDDIVISQIAAVEEIRKANPGLKIKEVYRSALKIGVDHISSMVNTLFLAYAGAALPLLLLFSIKEPTFITFTQVINHEIIAQEIVRSLVGSLGLVLAVPVSTLLASYFLKPQTAKL